MTTGGLRISSLVELAYQLPAWTPPASTIDGSPIITPLQRSRTSPIIRSRLPPFPISALELPPAPTQSPTAQYVLNIQIPTTPPPPVYNALTPRLAAPFSETLEAAHVIGERSSSPRRSRTWAGKTARSSRSSNYSVTAALAAAQLASIPSHMQRPRLYSPEVNSPSTYRSYSSTRPISSIHANLFSSLEQSRSLRSSHYQVSLQPTPLLPSNSIPTRPLSSYQTSFNSRITDVEAGEPVYVEQSSVIDSNITLQHDASNSISVPPKLETSVQIRRKYVRAAMVYGLPSLVTAGCITVIALGATGKLG